MSNATLSPSYANQARPSETGKYSPLSEAVQINNDWTQRSIDRLLTEKQEEDIEAGGNY